MMTESENKIMSVIRKHKSGLPVGITSICSVNEFVIKASMLNAKKHETLLLIESTSNQVDQFGGYTGMTPNIFRDYVYRLADSLEFPKENIALGGDHLGPNAWQNDVSKSAIEKAKTQISAYVNAGYSKIHLDASMKCADDGDKKLPLSPAVVAERAAIMCKAAEEAAVTRANSIEQPVYIIGTDVPPPGGSKEENDLLKVTSSEEMEETVKLSKEAFLKYGLEKAWDRVAAVVVQPGVEFGDEKIFDYKRDKAAGLTKGIEKNKQLVFEAHSTDFQLAGSLKQMVEDHFAILKVGPWLTYAFREAVFALVSIEEELFSNRKDISLSNLINVVESVMNQKPGYWEKYYFGNDEDDIKFKKKYSLSDRIRYYWNDNLIMKSLEKLFRNLSECEIPLTLLSQYLPESFEAVRSGESKKEPEHLIINRISKVLDKYNYATII